MQDWFIQLGQVGRQLDFNKSHMAEKRILYITLRQQHSPALHFRLLELLILLTGP